MGQKDEFEKAYTEVMPKPYSPRTFVECSAIPLLSEKTVVEIRAWAYIPK